MTRLTNPESVEKEARLQEAITVVGNSLGYVPQPYPSLHNDYY